MKIKKSVNPEIPLGEDTIPAIVEMFREGELYDENGNHIKDRKKMIQFTLRQLNLNPKESQPSIGEDDDTPEPQLETSLPEDDKMTKSQALEILGI